MGVNEAEERLIQRTITLNTLQTSNLQPQFQLEPPFVQGSSHDGPQSTVDEESFPDYANEIDTGMESPNHPDVDQNEDKSSDGTSDIQEHEKDDIKIQYHLKSGKPEEIYHFHEYSPTKPNNVDIPVDTEPWRPFHTQLDFELAELMLDTHMNATQTETLLSLIHQCIKCPDSLTISNMKDLNRVWEQARKTCATGFTHETIKVDYKGNDKVFEVSTCPLWDWCFDLVSDPHVVSQFHWDAERYYKFDGKRTWVRFIDEPWTADDWWDIQSQLPDGASPICIIIYADKTQLSSFGTAKGYPVLARCANLPTDVCNGEGKAGGRLVGWLPIIEEDAGETGKKGDVNFK
ncbi:unnamed protein product [Cyclocybe aegerita]|uniref:Uncharacterized protein n=1 Tax=Cyclocybe aegerita TaxID=1973307 RepID=A0A8S0VR80_CYCAE|nr:unnamed protein product [Cyclocybe aegerita]